MSDLLRKAEKTLKESQTYLNNLITDPSQLADETELQRLSDHFSEVSNRFMLEVAKRCRQLSNDKLGIFIQEYTNWFRSGLGGWLISPLFQKFSNPMSCQQIRDLTVSDVQQVVGVNLICEILIRFWNRADTLSVLLDFSDIVFCNNDGEFDDLYFEMCDSFVASMKAGEPENEMIPLLDRWRDTRLAKLLMLLDPAPFSSFWTQISEEAFAHGLDVMNEKKSPTID